MSCDGASVWSTVARLSGMVDAFSASARSQHPPWSPTANLMLRRTAPASSADARSEAPRDALAGQRAEEVAEAEAQLTEEARLLPGRSADDGGRSTLGWCAFDTTLPRNGGAEDVDICLRAAVFRDRAVPKPLPGCPTDCFPGSLLGQLVPYLGMFFHISRPSMTSRMAIIERG